MEDIQLVCYFILALVELGCQAVLFDSLGDGRLSGGAAAAVSAAFTVLAAALCEPAARLVSGMEPAEFPLAVMAIPSILFFFLISNRRGLGLITTFCIANVSLALADLVAYLVSAALFRDCFAAACALRCAAGVVWTAVLRSLLAEKYGRALGTLEKGWGLMLVITLAMYVLMWSVIFYPKHIMERTADIPFAILFTLMLELFIILLLRVVYTTLQAQEREGRAKQLEFCLREAERQYSMLSGTVAEIRRVRHDMKYHMNAMGAMLDRGDYDGLRRYFSDYRSTLAPLEGELPVLSKNQTVNILAVYYRDLALSSGTEFELELSVPERLGVDNVHLTALIGNMWQNALEACRSLPFGRQRYIRTKMRAENGILAVKCANSALETVQNGSGGFLSTKSRERGLGLGSVREIAELYSGSVHCEMSGDEFIFSALLHLREDGDCA